MKLPIRAMLVFLGLLVSLGNAHSATVTWTNTSGGNWSVAANWNPNQVPGANDRAVITNSRSSKIFDV